MVIEEKYMVRCLSLAKSGISSAAPNPMVGSVIVYKDRIIGEGFHQRFGGMHAEVNAIASVKDESLLKDATLYVNLEPCSHYGKTPPCAELIIRKGIPRVVVGTLDPFPEVSGRGIRMLQDAGVEVIVGILQEEAMSLNRYFMKFNTANRPYVILKWAQSRDGFIDRTRVDGIGPPVRFSTPSTQRLLHKLRSEVSSILVGTNTAVLDNPSLTVRHWSGNSPVRVVLDRFLRIPVSHHLMDGSVQTLVFTELPASNRKNVEYVRSDFSVSVIPYILQTLYERKLNSLLVEGGSLLHHHFLELGLYDEIRIETASFDLFSGVKAPDIQSLTNLNREQHFVCKSCGFDANMITVFTC